MAERRLARRKKNAVDLKPRLNDVSEALAPLTKIDYAIKLGLGDPDQLYYFRQVMADPHSAVQNPMLRKYLAEVAERALNIIFNDPQTWVRAQTILRRKYPHSVAARMSEAAYTSLARRAERAGVDVDVLIEAWARGLAEGGDDAAFARVNSLLDGGQRDQDLRPKLLDKIRKALGHD